MRFAKIIVVLINLVVLYPFARSVEVAAADNAGPSPVPLPSATNCLLFQQLYPPTQQAFDAHQLTKSQRAEILKWIKKIPRKDSNYAKWMRPGWNQAPGLVLIFDTKPVEWVEKNGHSLWGALNSNVVLDPTTCEIHAYPEG